MAIAAPTRMSSTPTVRALQAFQRHLVVTLPFTAWIDHCRLACERRGFRVSLRCGKAGPAAAIAAWRSLADIRAPEYMMVGGRTHSNNVSFPKISEFAYTLYRAFSNLNWFMDVQIVELLLIAVTISSMFLWDTKILLLGFYFCCCRCSSWWTMMQPRVWWLPVIPI